MKADHKRIKVNGKSFFIHVLIAEKVLGRKLRNPEQVHHVDCKRGDNSNKNLVICPNQAYHELLHIRTEALEYCGKADYRKCVVCKQWDDTSQMSNRNSSRNNSPYAHYSCSSKELKRQRAARKSLGIAEAR